jgi:hypothetical protein
LWLVSKKDNAIKYPLQMDDFLDPLEALWSGLLSRRPDTIRTAFQTLSHEEQQAVLEHLRRMASEPGWHPEQRQSAEAALETLERE